MNASHPISLPTQLSTGESPSLDEAPDSEALAELSAMARKGKGAIPPEVLARHVLAVTEGGDWPVRRAAMEALLRRREIATRQGLRVATKPAGGVVLGTYETRTPRAEARPYATLLTAIEPPAGSCSCSDYVKNSLGLCKHLLVILDDLYRRPRVLARGIARQQAWSTRGPRLTWDPIRPLIGADDPLERIRFVGGSVPLYSRTRSVSSHLVQGGPLPTRPSERLEVVEELLRFVGSRAGSSSDPALRPLLLAERDRLRMQAAALSRREVAGALRSLRLKLYPYQREGLERFLETGRLLLADDMGLGKTAQAIAAAHVLYTTGRLRKGLVIVPASLKAQWAREWTQYTQVPVTVVDGSAKEREAHYRGLRSGFLICNYEQVIRDLPALRRMKPELVILDEAQRMKNWETQTALQVKRLEAPYRLVLTGTPMENRLDELASVLEWVDDRALEPRWRLSPWHATRVDGKSAIAGARNLDTLRARMAPVLVRRTRTEVLGQLPPRTDIRVPVEMSPEQAAEHDALYPPIAALLHRANARPLTQAEFLRLMSLLTQQRILCNGLALHQFQARWPEIAAQPPSETLIRALCAPKLLELRERIFSLAIEQGRKVVVFSQWRRMLQLADWAVRDGLEREGLRAVFFSGHEAQKRRTHNLIDFHDDPNARVLFATDAGGVGLNLQRAANAMINLELPWNPAVLEQRIGRIHRNGQKQPVEIHHLITARGIEARIAEVVSDKRALFSGLFDGSSDEVHFDQAGSFLDRVEGLVPAELQGTTDADGDEDLDLEEGEDFADEVPDVSAAAFADDHQQVDHAAKVTGPRPSDDLDAAAPLDGPEVERLLGQLEIRTTESGGMVIEAPPQAAATLASLFAGMARLLSPRG